MQQQHEEEKEARKNKQLLHYIYYINTIIIVMDVRTEYIVSALSHKPIANALQIFRHVRKTNTFLYIYEYIGMNRRDTMCLVCDIPYPHIYNITIIIINIYCMYRIAQAAHFDYLSVGLPEHVGRRRRQNGYII